MPEVAYPPKRRVLLIAFHYPPCATSSGLQRTLSFSVHLRQHGWHPIVLTAKPWAYERTNQGQLHDIPEDVPVVRTAALDTARHLALHGRYWSRLSLPDRWRSWWCTAVPHGLHLVRRHRIDAIWSTYPIATSHAIANTIARLTGLPWVADFRDPMVEYLPESNEHVPRDAALRRARLRIEAKATLRASKLVFCTESARRIASERYPGLDGSGLAVIPNGYEENAFRAAEQLVAPSKPPMRKVLLHSGTVYPGPDRDPTCLFSAIRGLADRAVLNPENFELRLRDPSNEDYFRRLADRIGVGELVRVLGPCPYHEALAEMRAADGLLVLQGSHSNPAIPAKLYEYLRARRPVLGLVDPGGETGALLRTLGIDSCAQLTSKQEIAGVIDRWMTSPAALEDRLPSPDLVARFSRGALTARLAAILDEVTG